MKQIFIFKRWTRNFGLFLTLILGLYLLNANSSYAQDININILSGNFSENSIFRTDSIYPDAYHGRGSVYLEMGKYEEAIKDFSESISLNPQYPDAYVQREYAKSFLKDYEGWVNRGISLTASGRYKEALDSYDRALRYNTDDDTAWYNKAAIYALQGNVSSAVEHLKQAIKLNPERKEDAKTDPDFDSIREQPEFKELFRSKRFFIF